MSWAEVKKALNTNLDVPLNELIEGIVSSTSTGVYSYDSVYGKLGGGTHTLLNVSGKGRLKGLLVCDYTKADGTDLEIILDGVSYNLQVRTGSSSNGYKYICFVNPSDVISSSFGSSSNNYWYLFGIEFPFNILKDFYDDPNGTKFIPELRDETFTSPSYNHCGIWMHMNNYINFNKSLVIKAVSRTESGGSFNYGIGYRLDE